MGHGHMQDIVARTYNDKHHQYNKNLSEHVMYAYSIYLLNVHHSNSLNNNKYIIEHNIVSPVANKSLNILETLPFGKPRWW